MNSTATINSDFVKPEFRETLQANWQDRKVEILVKGALFLTAGAGLGAAIVFGAPVLAIIGVAVVALLALGSLFKSIVEENKNLNNRSVTAGEPTASSTPSENDAEAVKTEEQAHFSEPAAETKALDSPRASDPFVEKEKSPVSSKENDSQAFKSAQELSIHSDEAVVSTEQPTTPLETEEKSTSGAEGEADIQLFQGIDPAPTEETQKENVEQIAPSIPSTSSKVKKIAKNALYYGAVIATAGLGIALGVTLATSLGYNALNGSEVGRLVLSATGPVRTLMSSIERPLLPFMPAIFNTQGSNIVF